MNIIPVEAIYERDTDLLLLEEFSCNEAFCNWFLAQNNLPHLTQLEGVYRSINDFNLGETDILVSYLSGDEKIYLLVENKLDAAFQKEQQNRYALRGKKYIASGKCVKSFCLLVAPQHYLENQNAFELTVSYEQIKAWLLNQNDKRSDFKAHLLGIAIEKLRRGYVARNDEKVQQFFYAYWKYKNESMPELEMKEPITVPSGSDWPQLKIKAINKPIVHKLSRGHLDVHFNNKEKRTILNLSAKLPADIKLIEKKDSLYLRMETEPLNREEDFEAQIYLVGLAFVKIKKLNSWLVENKKLLG